MKRWLRRLSALGLLGGVAGWFIKKRSGSDAAASDAAWPPLRLVDPIPPTRPNPASATTVQVEDLADADTAPYGFASIPEPEPEAEPEPGSEPGPVADGLAESVAGRWVEPVDGACPISHPIKANAQSMIFHVPGGRSYARTIAERCYTSGDAAVADGYRRAKV